MPALPETTEKYAWHHWLRPALHAPAHGRVAWKLEDRYRAGMPDLLGHVNGRVWLAELKHAPKIFDIAAVFQHAPIPIGRHGVSAAQHAYLRQWGGARNRAYVFLSVAAQIPVTDEIQPVVLILDPQILPVGPAAVTTARTLFTPSRPGKHGLRELITWLGDEEQQET